MTANATVSRRSVLGSLAAAPVLGSTGISTENSTADTQLLRLGREFIDIAAKIDDAINGRSELTDELLNHLSCLDADIVATRAFTMEGLCVKAEAACWALLGDLDPAGQPTTDKRMALSIVRDLIRLYNPGLERPGALRKLVEESETGASGSIERP